MVIRLAIVFKPISSMKCTTANEQSQFFFYFFSLCSFASRLVCTKKSWFKNWPLWCAFYSSFSSLFYIHPFCIQSVISCANMQFFYHINTRLMVFNLLSSAISISLSLSLPSLFCSVNSEPFHLFHINFNWMHWSVPKQQQQQRP